MKKAIVTGANGFVGRYLIAQLANLKYDIWAVVRNGSENISFIESYHPHIVNCDLADFAKLSTLIPTGTYECFYHLAWAGSSGSARADYALQLINAKACAEAAESAAGLGCKRFVGAGSITQLMYGDYLMQDGCQPEPVTQYAIAKTAGQNMARCICTEKNVDFLWGYISNLYGVGDVSQNIVNFLIKSYLDGKTPILTSGVQDADFIYVSDVADALIAMAESGKDGTSYYIGFGNPRPLYTFVTEIRDLIDPHLDTGLGGKVFRGLSPDFQRLDIQKLQRDTGFIPKIPFKGGIVKTTEWIKSTIS